MMGRLMVTAALLVSVAACGRVSESRFNPINWFGQSRPAAAAPAGQALPAVPLIAQVTALRIEKVPGGAIIHATGLPARQGFHSGDLVPLAGSMAENGVLSYQFTISAPTEPTPVGTPRSREVIVGLFVSDQTLEGVRQIRVNAQSNALVVRR